MTDTGAEGPIARWAEVAWTWTVVQVADAVVTRNEPAHVTDLGYSVATHDVSGRVGVRCVGTRIAVAGVWETLVVRRLRCCSVTRSFRS